MGTVVTNSGSGTFGEIASWTVNETVTPFVAGDQSAGFGDGSLTVVRKGDTELAIDNDLVIIHDVLGTAKLKVNNVNLASTATAVLSADSIMGQFISGAVFIPGVESGSPISALDLACQLAGIRRCSDSDSRAVYWSLAGHSAGFDWQGRLVMPKGFDRTYNKANVFYQKNVEPVQYEEILNLVSIDMLVGGTSAAAIYPQIVVGPTPRITTARTYVKFTTAGATGVFTFSFNTGPDFRDYGGFVADSTETATVTYNPATKALTTTILYRDGTGNATTVTSPVISAGALLSGDHCITIETYMLTTGEMLLGANVTDSAGTNIATSSVITSALSAGIAPIYAGQFTISSTGGGIRDLIVKESPLATSGWSNFYNPGYTNAAPFVSNLTSPHFSSPIAATRGELWDYIKQIGSGTSVDIAPTPAGIVLREVGARVLDLGNSSGVTRTISVSAVGRNVAVVNKNTSNLITPTTVLDSVQAYSVDVGGVNKTLLSGIDLGVRWLYSPRVDPTPGAGFTYPNATTLQPQSRGYYYVMAKDNLPVSPTEWIYYGGRVTAAIDSDGVASVTLTGPRVKIPGVSGPFSVAFSDGVVARPKLILAGLGVLSSPYTVTLPTGVDPNRTNVDLAATIDNVAISNIGLVYDRGAWAVARASGPSMSLTTTVSIFVIKQFGLVAGSIIKSGYAKYRVDSLSITSAGIATLTCSKLTTIGDYQDLGLSETVAQLTARWAGYSLSDFAIRPLLT